MKKTLSLFLALCMVFTKSPVSAMAEEVYLTPDTEIIAFEPLADTEQSVAIGTAIEDLALPKTLTATVKKAVNAKEEAEQNSGIPEEYMASGSVPDAAWVEISQEISVIWACQTQYDKDTAGEYLFAPVIIGYELKDGVELPQIKVTVVAVALRSVKTTVVSTRSALGLAFRNSTDGEIIQLGADIEFGDTDDRLELYLGQKSVTLDLNGHTLDSKSKSAIYLSTGTLTITDNTPEAKGIITSTAFGTIQPFTDCHLIIEGGTVSSTNDVIVCQSNSKLSVKGGKVEAVSYGAAINGGSGLISITGGEVIAGTGKAIKASKILISGDAKITSAAMFGTIEFARDDETSSFTMTGGLVENTAAGAALDFETGGSFSISGGTIQNTGTGSAIKVSFNPKMHFIGGDAKIINSDATKSTIDLQINSYYGTPGLTISGATIQNLSTGYAVQCTNNTIPVFIIGDKTTVIKSNQTAMNTVPDPDEGFRVVDSEGAELVLTSANMPNYKHLEFQFLGSPTDVASIGEDTYGLLQEAVDAVGDMGDGQTITLLKDTSKGFTIPVGNTASFTLDLNGHALQSKYDVAIIHNGSGKLTVNDTSGGKITARSKYNPAIEAIALNGGSLEVMKGTIEGRKHVIYNRGSGTVTISGGTIRCSAGGSFAIYNASDGIVSIKNGIVSGDCVIYSNEDGTVYVSGGELINNASTAHRDNFPTIETDGSIYISGGTISGNRNLALKLNTVAGKTVEISGGTLTSSYDNTVWINVKCILSISGGTIKNTGSKNSTIYSYNASYSSEPAKVEIKEGSPILITGPVMAMNIAPDMSTYTNVKIMASTTATDGTATSQITKAHIDTNEKTRAYKYLEFTADTTAPSITSVSKTSADGTYSEGESLSFAVDFDKIVNVTGTPHLVLRVGSQTRQADYQSGSGTTSLTFSYTVQSGDMDDDGIECVSPITLNGGTITDASGNDAVLTFTPPDTTGIRVDATAPSITTQPLYQTVNEGQTATFSVAASSTSLLSYQWQIDTTGTGSSFATLPGITGISYTTPATTSSMNGYLYRCKVTNAAGTIYSDAAKLTVRLAFSATPTAAIDTQAKTNTVQASLSYTLTNSPAYDDAQEWRVYTDPTGTTQVSGVVAANIGNILTLSHATDLPVGVYYVAVTESGKTESARLALTVGASAALTGTVTISPYPRIGNHLNVQVSSNNSGTLSYVWKADGVQVGTDMIYTVAAADYGKIITLEITSSVQSGSLTSNSTAAVAKKIAPAAPSAPVLSSKTHNSVTLVTNPAYEYSKDGTTWQKSNVFGDLTASMEYTFYQRVAETSDTEKSAASGNLSVTTDASSSYIYTVTFRNGSSVHATKTVAYPAMTIDTLPNNPTNGRYTFSGWYTGINGSGTRFSATTPVVSNLTVYPYWTGGGSSDEDGSSSDDNDSVIANPAPSDRPNPPTQGELRVSGTVDAQGNATVNLSDRAVSEAFDKALTEAKRNGNEQNGIALVLRVDTGSNNAPHVRVNLPKTVQDIIIAKKIVNTILVVDNPDITIALDLASVKTINSQANSDVHLTATRMESNTLTDAGKTAIGSRPVFDLGVNYGNGKQVQSFGTGSVTVTIPYTLGANEHAGNVQAVYVDTNGKAHWLVNSVYDSVNQVLRFSTSHFSTYGVGYRQGAPVLTDITTHWAKDAMQFVANRGLITGTTGTTFSPNTAMTRGALVTALGRLAKVDVSGYKQSSFTDVKSDAYYMAYIEWANRNNILNGIGNGKFAPDRSITREQMAVIIQNYAKVIGFRLPKVHAENHFADSAKISASAKDAVKQMQMAGIIGSKNGNLFDPQGIVTRAEVSVILRRFVELMLSSDAMEGWWMNDSGQWMYYENGKPCTGSRNFAGLTYIFDQYGVTVDLPRRSKDGTYTVQKGDSFWLIAHKLGCTMSDLERLNNKSRFDLIIPGDVLRVSEK